MTHPLDHCKATVPPAERAALEKRILDHTLRVQAELGRLARGLVQVPQTKAERLRQANRRKRQARRNRTVSYRP